MKITSTSAKDHIKVYITSNYLIQKKNIHIKKLGEQAVIFLPVVSYAVSQLRQADNTQGKHDGLYNVIDSGGGVIKTHVCV